MNLMYIIYNIHIIDINMHHMHIIRIMLHQIHFIHFTYTYVYMICIRTYTSTLGIGLQGICEATDTSKGRLGRSSKSPLSVWLSGIHQKHPVLSQTIHQSVYAIYAIYIYIHIFCIDFIMDFIANCVCMCPFAKIHKDKKLCHLLATNKSSKTKSQSTKRCRQLLV